MHSPRAAGSRSGATTRDQASSTRVCSGRGSCCCNINTVATTPHSDASPCSSASATPVCPLSPGVIQQHAHTGRSQRTTERTQRSASPEVAPAHTLGNQVAHPRHPGVVAEHAQHRGEARDTEQHALPCGLRDRQERQGHQGQGDLARSTHQQHTRAPSPEERRGPGRRAAETAARAARAPARGPSPADSHAGRSPSP